MLEAGGSPRGADPDSHHSRSQKSRQGSQVDVNSLQSVCGYHGICEAPPSLAEGFGGLLSLFAGPEHPLDVRPLGSGYVWAELEPDGSVPERELEPRILGPAWSVHHT